MTRKCTSKESSLFHDSSSIAVRFLYIISCLPFHCTLGLLCSLPWITAFPIGLLYSSVQATQTTMHLLDHLWQVIVLSHFVTLKLSKSHSHHYICSRIWFMVLTKLVSINTFCSLKHLWASVLLLNTQVISCKAESTNKEAIYPKSLTPSHWKYKMKTKTQMGENSKKLWE